MKYELEVVRLTSDIIVTSGGSACAEDCDCFDPIGGGIMAN